MTNGSHDVINPGHHSFLGEAWVKDYRHGSNYSSRNLAEDRTVYSVEHPKNALLGEPSVSTTSAKRYVQRN